MTTITIDLHGKIDFAIITIKEEEFLAVYDRLKPNETYHGKRTMRAYDIGEILTLEGRSRKIVLARLPAQGEGQAQDVARDIIEDFDPKWLLLVGIGGAVPSLDFTLGDVVCATRVHDFSVRAVKEASPETFASAGGPMHKAVESLLARLPGIVRRLGNWNSEDLIKMKMPTLEIPQEDSNQLYGNEEWKKEVRQCLIHHFDLSGNSRLPNVTARSIASSDTLVKDTHLLSQWLTEARAIAAIEMELAGVYLAARRYKEYPILAIRGISDIVGFKRNEAWTKYACNSAAAFTFALLKSNEISLFTSEQPVKSEDSESQEQALNDGHFNMPETPSFSSQQKIAAACNSFLNGIPSQNGIGFDFLGLIFSDWLSQRGKSMVAKYYLQNTPFVIKKTLRNICDVGAIQAICGAEIEVYTESCKVKISTPLAIRIDNDWVYELHIFYVGIGLDKLVKINRYQICGDYLACMHNGLAEALHYLHKQGLAHRDVRPQNFLLLSDCSLVLLDCSFVCFQDSAQIPINSGAYTAPEQKEGKATYKSDWYSLAATLFFVATGLLPYQERLQNDENWNFRTPYFAYTPPRHRWKKMLSPNPKDRPDNYWGVLVDEHTAPGESDLLSVLDMESMGYLVITTARGRVVERSEINNVLSTMKCNEPTIKQSIKKHLNGYPEWLV